jgi:hypothetical protein
MGLSLREKAIIDHTQLSHFRKSLTFVQQINLLVYILHHFLKSGLLVDEKTGKQSRKTTVKDKLIVLNDIDLNEGVIQNLNPYEPVSCVEFTGRCWTQ